MALRSKRTLVVAKGIATNGARTLLGALLASLLVTRKGKVGKFQATLPESAPKRHSVRQAKVSINSAPWAFAN